MKPRFTAFYQLLPVFTIVLLAGCAAHKRVASHTGCYVSHNKPFCTCRTLEIMSLDVQHGETILKCTH